MFRRHRSAAPTSRGQAMVEAMGGEIAVESALGRGTTVTVRLPAEAATDSEHDGSDPEMASPAS